MEPDTTRIGKAIRQRRMYLCLSQTALAESTGVQRSTICALENGKRVRTSLDALVALADGLNWNDTQLGAMARAMRGSHA